MSKSKPRYSASCSGVRLDGDTVYSTKGQWPVVDCKADVVQELGEDQHKSVFSKEGFVGAVVGTVMWPGVGTILGAFFGSLVQEGPPIFLVVQSPQGEIFKKIPARKQDKAIKLVQYIRLAAEDLGYLPP